MNVPQFAIARIAAALLAVVWYYAALTVGRRRALEVVRWIEVALAGHGHITGMRWLSASSFSLTLAADASVFRRPRLLVQMEPLQSPVNWLLFRLRGKRAAITFQADLDYAPGFALQAANQRWFGRSLRSLDLSRGNWDFEETAPFVLASSRRAHFDVFSLLNALLASRRPELISIALQRTSPHFCATIGLKDFLSEGQQQPEFFAMLHQLARQASAAS